MDQVDLIDNNWSDQYEEALCGESSIFQNENNTHQYDGIENVVCENFKPSAYVVLEKYLKCGKIINETYITGYIDGEDNYNNVSLLILNNANLSKKVRTKS